eukprot:CAMPEP_0179312074 /NCGR_PEP_ID=MMETSP0797-20121207/53043_1 /TAXON_ID=47934 /ORGANISM="Dinophysis acuminata, Strain DAEP01" /LENGTH=72 /DNA_ID=CAMNT_0021021925 /DNA_START=120 /DNA_END=335 /DNA_ORIENTATION=-
MNTTHAHGTRGNLKNNWVTATILGDGVLTWSSPELLRHRESPQRRRAIASPAPDHVECTPAPAEPGPLVALR